MSKLFWVIVFMVLFVKAIESPMGIILGLGLCFVVILKVIHSITRRRKRKYDEPY